MKFRFYITDTYDGCIKGTNDPEAARAFAECEDFFVVDTETGRWLVSAQDDVEIEDAHK
jgi:predicted Fe-Mo cluster-binding NifX family protein